MCVCVYVITREFASGVPVYYNAKATQNLKFENGCIYLAGKFEYTIWVMIFIFCSVSISVDGFRVSLWL